MDLSKLPDYQLYEIIQNSQLDNDIRSLANVEFTSRKLSSDQIKQIVLRHDSEFKPPPHQRLETKYKLILILFPFFIPIQGIIANRYLIRGQKGKWKDYWFYVSLGYLLWTVGIILFSKLILFTNENSKNNEIIKTMQSEHAVIITFNYGIQGLDSLHKLEEKLEKVINEKNVGEYDGHEIAVDYSDGILYMYGPNAEQLFMAIEPTLKETNFLKGAKAKLRFGPPEDDVKEIDLDL